MYLIIDNYDSFTYNLLHYMGEEGAELTVRRNDAVTIDEALALGDQGIVLSPGPCEPDQAGICLELTNAAAGQRPILGVCLGHQSIGQAFGGRDHTTVLHHCRKIEQQNRTSTEIRQSVEALIALLEET